MRLLIFSVFMVAAQIAFGQLDSLYNVLEHNPSRDTVRVNTLFSICYRESTSNPDKNKAHAMEALEISQELNFRKGMGKATRYIALYYWAVGDYAQAKKNAYDMLRIFEDLMVSEPNTSSAKGVGQANQLLGLINEVEGNYEKANACYQKALEIYQRMNLKTDIGYGFNSLGALNLAFKKYDLAKQYFLKSMVVRTSINDCDGLSQTYSNLALIYTHEKDYSLALEYYQKAAILNEKLNNRFRMAVNFAGLGEFYRLTGDNSKAEYYLHKSAEVARGIRNKYVLEDAYAKLTLLEKGRNQFEKALKYSELSAAYRDSVFTEAKAKKIAEIETRYETEKKDQVIQLLKRDKEIQSLWTNIVVAAFVLFVILSVVIYFLQRYKDGKNRRILNLEIDYLTTQQKELSEKYKDALTSGGEKPVESQDQRLLKKAIEVVEKNIEDPLFGVEKMAREIGMSRTNLHRKIKAITGFPPSELIRSIRLRKAAVLLRNQAASISQISYMVGFEDHSYFSKSFKKHFGVSPSEYVQSEAAAVPTSLSKVA